MKAKHLLPLLAAAVLGATGCATPPRVPSVLSVPKGIQSKVSPELGDPDMLLPELENSYETEHGTFVLGGPLSPERYTVLNEGKPVTAQGGVSHWRSIFGIARASREHAEERPIRLARALDAIFSKVPEANALVEVQVMDILATPMSLIPLPLWPDTIVIKGIPVRINEETIPSSDGN